MTQLPGSVETPTIPLAYDLTWTALVAACVALTGRCSGFHLSYTT